MNKSVYHNSTVHLNSREEKTWNNGKTKNWINQTVFRLKIQIVKVKIKNIPQLIEARS